jgi:chitodextrinase
VPTGLAAVATSSSATILSWNASIVPGNGVVTGYAILENDHQIATVTGTSYTVANLTANTTYTFSVAALDAAGSSAETTPISVHTTPSIVPGDGNHAHEFSYRGTASRQSRPDDLLHAAGFADRLDRRRAQSPGERQA